MHKIYRSILLAIIASVVLFGCGGGGSGTTTGLLPGAPTGVTATGSNASASIAFTAPTNTGGSAITNYTATSNPGNISASSASSPILVAGLTNGTAYTFTVTATNSAGIGSASTASNSVVPNPVVPDAPTIVSAIMTTATNLTVTFTPPANNGGAAITNYTVYFYAAQTLQGSATGSSSPISQLASSPGCATVTATNSAGEGPQSAQSCF